MSKVTYKAIKNMPEVNAYIEQGNRVLGALGYTEHSRGHAVKVAETAGNILDNLGYNQHKIELAKIAGYMHDILQDWTFLQHTWARVMTADWYSMQNMRFAWEQMQLW